MGPVGLRAKIEAAGAAGFRGMSLWGGDRARAHRDGLTDDDIRRLLADNGVVIAELDGLSTWLPGTEAAGVDKYGPDHPYFGHSETDFYEIADALGARSLSVNDLAHLPITVDAAAEAFAGVCDRAAEHGLLVHIEFMALSSISSLRQAWAVVDAAGRANGGLLVDSWHLLRTSRVEDLALVPPDRIFATQFSDGSRTRHPDPWQDSADRLLPGDGELALGDIVEWLRTSGCAAPVGIEVLNRELMLHAPDEIARRCHASITRLLETTAVDRLQ